MKHFKGDKNHIESWKVSFTFDYLNTDIKTIIVYGSDVFEAMDVLQSIFQPSWLSQHLMSIELELPF